ncbi:hypothetical protein [Burkholderia ubonensis]|uniref:hypothetical protein n=1 Tax=Burkholderia ubonensis TaxID=101571 RepID=UPI000ADDA658|nr:hypothetical protein [Burkholderia ubonensis]
MESGEVAARLALAELAAEFDEAYRAFVGAFDTPQMRYIVSGEYADDARKRLKAFAEHIATLAG